MKIAIIGAESSIHIQRWMKALCAHPDLSIHLITLHADNNWSKPKNLTVHKLSNVPTIGYLFGVFELKRFMDEIKPDILHTHYATGYGTLGSLSKFHPRVLSVWGSDVYEFPYSSPIHKMMVATYLKSADIICSTSEAMIEQVMRVAEVDRNKVRQVAFGVDTGFFKPLSIPKKDTITVGIVKNLAPTYGVDILINAFAQAHAELPTDLSDRLRLLIGGDGPQLSELKSLAGYLGLKDLCEFRGRQPHAEVPLMMNEIDIFVAPSRSESFGVAVIEASACGKPVIVSNAGGLPEVVRNGETGLVVEKENVPALAEAIKTLAKDTGLRQKMGAAGREWVKHRYEWSVCVDEMVKVYNSLLSTR